MKAIITISDNPNDKVGINLVFDPPNALKDRKTFDESNAGQLAVRALQFLMDQRDEGTEAKVRVTERKIKTKGTK